MTDSLPANWRGFLQDIDATLHRPVELHCLGGFVLLVRFGLPRPTYDVDFIVAIPNDTSIQLVELAGKGTPLAQKHALYLDRVTVSDFPDDYEDRLIDLATPELQSLKLRTLEPHDLVLAKLTRNSPKDVHDVQFLAEQGVLDPSLLEVRYHLQLRPYLLTTERHDLTLELWLEVIRNTQHQRATRDRLARHDRTNGDKEP
jgi:hypothetical protein